MMKHLLLFLFILLITCSITRANSAVPPRTQFFFVENKGQVTDQNGAPRTDVKYIFQSGNFKLVLKENSWSYELSHAQHVVNERAKNFSGETPDPEFDRNDALQFQTERTDVSLLNAATHPVVIAEEEASGTMNFYAGKNPTQGITGIPHFRKITYQNIYPGIDLVFEITATQKNIPVEYSFVVHPNADPDLIQLAYEGIQQPQLKNGSLAMKSSLGEVRESAPVYFSRASAKNNGAFLQHGNIISFSKTNFNRAQDLIIDPFISYSTYFGGDTSDYAEGLEIDGDHNIIVCGRTGSASNIATAGAYDITYGGGAYDMFLLKFNASFQLLWSTYFGGGHVDYGWALAIDSKNNIYLGGEAYSDSLATANAQQKTIEGSESDGLVAKFKPNGTLVWSRYFGGSAKDQVLGMCMDKTGRLIVTGYTLSTDSIATTGAYKTTYGGNGDIFLAALDTTNGNTFWSTYYGANKDDRGHHVTVDAHNNIYLSGTCLSTTGIATTGTFHSTLAGYFDGYLAKFTSAGFPIWGTYVGGANEDRGRDCVIDHNGNICMTGFSQSDTGIATSGTWKAARSPGIDSTGYHTLDAFIVKFDTNGHRLWGTYFGDTLSETSRGIAVNSNNDIYITGATYSTQNIDHGSNPFQTNIGGVSDAYVAKFNKDGGLVYSSYFGGSNEEQVGGYGLLIRTDDQNSIYLCSSTHSTDSIATDNAYQTSNAGGFDVFIAKFTDTLIADGNSPPRIPPTHNHLIICPNPVKDLFFARVNVAQPMQAMLSVFAADGKLMMQKQVAFNEGENEIQFTAENFTPGLYFIVLNDGQSVITKKVLFE